MPSARARASLDAVANAQAAGELPPGAIAGLEELRAMLTRFGAIREKSTAPLPDLFDRLISKIDPR